MRWAYCAWKHGNKNKFLLVGLITTAFRYFSAFSCFFFSFRFGRARAYSISHFGHSQVSQIREISDIFVNRWTLMQGSLNEWDIHKDVLYLLLIICKYMRIWPSFRQCAPLSWNSTDGPSCFCWQISTSCTRSGLIWLFQLRRMWNTGFSTNEAQSDTYKFKTRYNHQRE